VSKSGNPMLAQDKELEMALVRLKAKCPEDCELVLGRLERDAGKFAADAAKLAADPSPGMWEAGRFVMGAYRAISTLVAAVREADGEEPEAGEKQKYDRSIDE